MRLKHKQHKALSIAKITNNKRKKSSEKRINKQRKKERGQTTKVYLNDAIYCAIVFDR